MNRTKEPILITGSAMATCLGLDRESTWAGVRQGRCGMGALSAMEQVLPEGRLGGQAPDLPADENTEQPREVRYLRRVILDALNDAGLGDGFPYAPGRCGMMIGTTLHGMRSGGEFLRSGSPEPLRNFLAAATLRAASEGLPIEGLSATTCSACSSSLGAVALGVSLLQSGQLDLVIAGGYDPISEYVYGGFNSLRLVSEGPLRPFAKGREGMKLAEGYAIVILERETDARRRDRAGLAKIMGFGESADAHHLTQPHPQGDGAARAMEAALRSAGLQPADIDLVAAHATGTPDNDAGEFAALSRIFADDLPRVPVVGFKSHLGHTLGGAGAVELILSSLAIRDQIVPPCANSRAEDVEFAGLNLATGAARAAGIRMTLNTSLGFGGANTCVVLSAPSPFKGEGRGEGETQETVTRWPVVYPHPHPLPGKEREESVFITGIGVVLPGAIGNEAFVRLLDENRRITSDTGPIPENDYLHLLNARRVRRMSEYVKLSLAATALAFADAGITDIPAFSASCSAILGSTHGSAGYSHEYYGQIVREGIFAANPMLFAEGVPNAGAAHLSLMMALKGACQTIIGTRTAGLDAMRLASMRIAGGDWDRAVVSAGEEFSEVVNRAYRHCGLYAGKESGEPFGSGKGFAAGAGAVTLILESSRSIKERAGRARGIVESCASSSPGQDSRISPTGQMLQDLGNPSFVISSANGTWLDRTELEMIRISGHSTGIRPVVTSISGHIPEIFSAGPLAAVAAALLTGKMPRLHGPGTEIGISPTGQTVADGGFAVLCSDQSGLMAGIRIRAL